MEIKLLRYGPAHTFGWQRRRNQDQANMAAWEDCDGNTHFADKASKVMKVKIGKRFTLSPMVYEYACDGIRTRTFIKPL